MGATFLGPLLPVGSVIHSMLTESQFQAQAGSGWVLADGRSVTSTAYATITGSSTIPDMRSSFLRGKDNAKGLNPDGDLALGTYTSDKYLAHTHTYAANNTGGGATALATGTTVTAQLQNTGPSGGNETAPKSITVNIFIRIN